MNNTVHKVVILIGNGFDLGMNMPTNWTDFRNWVLENKKIPNNSLVNYLSRNSESGQYWSDVEASVPGYLKETASEIALDDMDEFSEVFEEYLREVDVNMRYFINTEANIRTFNEGINNILAKLPENIDLDREAVELTFINFNYTSMLDWLLMEVTEKNSYDDAVFLEHPNLYLNVYNEYTNEYSFHVHGFLKDENSQVCIGVNHKAQLFSLFDNNSRILDKEEIYDLQTRFIKEDMVSISLDGKKRYGRAEAEIDSADSIVVYGLSLGTSDEKWSNRILRRVQEGVFNDNMSKIEPVFIAFESIELFKKKTTRKIRKIREIKSKFQNSDFSSEGVLIHFTNEIWQFPDSYGKK